MLELAEALGPWPFVALVDGGGLVAALILAVVVREL